MSFLDDGRSEHARDAARAAGRQQVLPVAARTFTAAEIGARNQSQSVLILLTLGGAIAILFVMLVGSEPDRLLENLRAYGPITLLVAVALVFFARARATRQEKYRDQ